jgi:hypothetical protein
MIRDFTLKVKAFGDAGTFTGYAATYGGVDLVGDTIAPGAFKQAIQSQGTGYPLLWAHDQSQPLGVGQISDSPGGLVVAGKLVMEDPGAVRALAHLRAGSIKGLSIGFQVPPGKSESTDDGGRLLKEVRLHEISLVACPADPRSLVTSVKSIHDVSRLLGGLRGADVDRKTLIDISAAVKRLLTAAKDAPCDCECPECMDGDCASCSDDDCMDENCLCGQDDVEEAGADLAALKSLAAELQQRV